jgi:hypothetical protein
LEAVIIVVAIISMLIVGATETMVPIMQNSFASKKSDFKKEHDTNINTNITCAVTVICPEGSTTSVISPPVPQPQPQPPTTGTLIISKICDPSCQGRTFYITVTGNNNNPQPSLITLQEGQAKSVTLGPGSFTVLEIPNVFPTPFFPHFFGDCKQTIFPEYATGTISAGQSKH